MRRPKLVIFAAGLVLIFINPCGPDSGWLRFGLVLYTATAIALIIIIVALLRAPEGYEDAKGFHVLRRSRGSRHPRHHHPL